MQSSTKPAVHLVCNAHLDPVWQWQWEEGAAEAMASFRVAADFCEEFQGFVFNHNEALLYEWIEQYDPALFVRICRLVRSGRWHIMGGWYLQPDCNMCSGESIIRQILIGRQYFQKKFGVTPTTAINFDPFGHSRGLVQILTQSGYNAYLFCRPGHHECPLPAEEFRWIGFAGTEVMGVRAYGFYLTYRGRAREKVESWLAHRPAKDGLILWGVGNHGGGPSRIDLKALNNLMRERNDYGIRHSTPEAFFMELAARRKHLPRYDKGINPTMVGCYTSMARIKQRHRLLENEFFSTEKMASAAAIQGLMDYPAALLGEAARDLLRTQFHDVLPGSSVPDVEEASLRLADHGLEILSRIKARTFFALAQGQPPAHEGEIPILIYNPHPYPVTAIWECEFHLADQHREPEFIMPSVYREGIQIPSQCEKENSNININWRKRVSFAAELRPCAMNRFDCRMVTLPVKPPPALKASLGRIRFKSDTIEVVINTQTGLVDRYRVNGSDYLARGAFASLVIEDDEDPWGMRVHGFRKVSGRFRLMSPEEASRFSGFKQATLPAVRVIEDGPVRAIVESLFIYGKSAICQRIKLPKKGSEIELETRVYWNEKDRMLKLAAPLAWRPEKFRGQTMAGVNELPATGNEAVAQKWLALVSATALDKSLTVINEGVYGSSLEEKRLRLTLLRSPAYCACPIDDRPVLIEDRFIPRMDQGERIFRFWINGGPIRERMEHIDREALTRNEKPMVLSMFPLRQGKPSSTPVQLHDDVVQVSAIKYAENSSDLIIRLFEPTGMARSTTLELPTLGIKEKIRLTGFEIKTLKILPKKRTILETDLLEQPKCIANS